MSTIFGYADPYTAAPGDAVRFYVSCSSASYTSQLLRLGPGWSGDNAPPVNHSIVPGVDPQTHTGREQYTRPGSYIYLQQWAGAEYASTEVDELKVEFWCYPSLPKGADHEQYLFSTLDSSNTGVACYTNSEGLLVVKIAGSEGTQEIASDEPLQRHYWYHLSIRIHRHGVEIATTRKASGLHEADKSTKSAHTFQRQVQCGPGKQLVIGTDHDIRSSPRAMKSASFNGKMESFSFFITADGGTKALVEFDFSRNTSDDYILDQHGNRGVLVNAPARAVTGHDWDAKYVDWTKAKYGYGAIAFHDDDVDDASWEMDFEVSLPLSLRSGCYGVHLDDGKGGTDIVPFFVRPSLDAIPPLTAFIVPTFTYAAYSNEHLYDASRAVHLPMGLDSIHKDRNLKALISRPDLGISLYDSHNDGSGTVYSSTKRPILNMRPDYVHWGYKGPRELPADLWFIGFLDRELGPDHYDVLTDHDISTSGADLLRRYKVLLSGSHPEYLSYSMLDAYSAFLSQGGSFLYLGGNGYYWVTTHDPSPARAHRIEVRRGDQGCRSFSLPQGEWHHAMSGERGGLWRARGRPPNVLFGIGCCACGMGTGAAYGIDPAARELPELRFLFEGIDAEIIGDAGLVQDAASGDEIDRFDVALGSPSSAVLIASSKWAGGHSDDYGLFPEECTFPVVNTLGTTSDMVRSDLVYFRTAAGGAVFAVGSISWVGAMAWKNYENPVAKITANALSEFVKRAESSSDGIRK